MNVFQKQRMLHMINRWATRTYYEHGGVNFSFALDTVRQNNGVPANLTDARMAAMMVQVMRGNDGFAISNIPTDEDD